RQSETRFKQRWTVTAAQYAALMCEGFELHTRRWLPMPRKQRGSIILAGFGVPSAGVSGSVSITAHTLADNRFSPGTIDARIEWQNDGQLFAFRQVGSDFEYNGEWWTNEIEASIGDDYECRHISTGKTGKGRIQA
ncbi:unnamed protein product, partial [marine sediment metagenome]